MGFGPFRGLPRRHSPGRSLWRWITVVAGVAVVGVALSWAVEPYQQTQEFRQQVGCDRNAPGCFGSEPGLIASRRTYTTSHYHDGHQSGETTHYEITWQRADGSQQSQDVSRGLYIKAAEGQPAILRTWRGEVVGVEVMGGAQWFQPQPSRSLAGWLHLAWFGLGVAVWGWALGWWDGLFMFAWRTGVWMFISLVPVSLTTEILAYGWPNDPIATIVVVLFFVGVPGYMLISWLKNW